MSKGKKLRGLTPFMGSGGAKFTKKVFGASTSKDPKGGKKLPDVQNK